jgi:hypothetical protein
MTLADLLRPQDYFGVSAPAFAWWAAATALVSVALALLWLAISVAILSSRFKRAARRLLEVGAADAPGQGLNPEKFTELETAFTGAPSLLTAWRGFAAQCVFRRNAQGAIGVFSSETAGAAFDEGLIIEPVINRSFFQAVPGIVTGFGLLITFVAILVALRDVNIDQNNEVQGLPNLIGGLSGKFVSSIAALLAATVYALIEKPMLHRLTARRLAVVHTLDAIVPRLSAVHLLSDMQRDIAEQSAAFRSFNTDLALKLRQGLSESMGPTLQRMVESIEGLNESLRSAEANRQQALTASLQAMTENLEQSIGQLLSELGSQFSTSLSGAAMGEFGKVTQSLGNTGELLEKMNVQFQATQSGLEELIRHAKTSTVEQMALGRSQVEELTAVLRGLMTQMSESAGRSVSDMASTLTGVVHELASRVSRLSDDLAAKVTEAGNKSSEAASRVVARAEHWSENTAEKLEQLISSHRDQLSHIEDARSALESTMVQFKNGIGDYASVSRELRGVLSETNAIATAAIGAAKSLKDAQDAAIKAATVTEAQVNALQAASQHQEEAWRQMHANLERYAQVFQRVDADASTLLTTIGQQLRDYTETTKKGTDAIVAAANDHFGTAAQRLKDSVETLDECLQELTEVLGKAGLGAKN